MTARQAGDQLGTPPGCCAQIDAVQRNWFPIDFDLADVPRKAKPANPAAVVTEFRRDPTLTPK